MKYMLMMNTPRGGDYGIATWPKKDIEAHIAFMIGFAKKLGAAGGIPALDLEVKRDTGTVLVVRLLLFRTYALALVLEVPAGVDPKQARELAGRFAPPAEKP